MSDRSGRTSPSTLPSVASACVVCALLAVGCGSGGDSSEREVVVFAAASLTEAFSRIGEEFEASHPGVDVTFSFAGSSELAAQILEGAPADVFASADLTNMARVDRGGAVVGEPTVVATNRTEIVVQSGNPLGVTGLADLADPDLVVVVCAPQVPCGAYAGLVVERAGTEIDPDSYESNVKAVVTKVAIGEADAGIAYATDVLAAAPDVEGVPLPVDVNVVAEYPLAVTSEGSNPRGARAFVDFVTGTNGAALLAEHGFGVP